MGKISERLVPIGLFVAAYDRLRAHAMRITCSYSIALPTATMTMLDL